MAKTDTFKITREDGRSNAQVIIDLVEGAEPGTLYRYDELGEALSAGTSRVYGRSDICGAVGQANDRLLREQCRSLHNVRGVGYRLALAVDHRRLALVRKSRADTQLKKGVLMLSNVKWDEMDPASRAAHEATLIMVSAVYEQTRSLERRQSATESVIQKLLGQN